MWTVRNTKIKGYVMLVVEYFHSTILVTFTAVKNLNTSSIFVHKLIECDDVCFRAVQIITTIMIIKGNSTDLLTKHKITYQRQTLYCRDGRMAFYSWSPSWCVGLLSAAMHQTAPQSGWNNPEIGCCTSEVHGPNNDTLPVLSLLGLFRVPVFDSCVGLVVHVSK